MTLAFSPPPTPRSLLSRLDPRWKLAALLFAAVIIATLHTLTAALLAWAAALVLAILGQLPARWFLQRLGAAVLFLLVFALPLPWLLADEGATWSLEPLHASAHGFVVAGLLIAKALALVTLFLVIQATASMEATLNAAHSLRIPGLFVQLGLLTHRYVFVLADELRRIRIALRVRGYRRGVNRRHYQTAGHVVGTLLVRGYERAERVGQAMRCRGFNGRFHSLTTFATRPVDVAAFLLIAASATAIAVWDWWPRLWG